MGMRIYYGITVAANIAAAVMFHKHIRVGALSAVPLFLIALMLFQAHTFRNSNTENGFRTAYGSDLTADEQHKLLGSGAAGLLVAVPWMVPFTLFFPSPVKLLCVLVYAVGLIGGPLVYRVRYRRSIAARMRAEEAARREQERREQTGWRG